MNWKKTWMLAGAALALFAFIWFHERHAPPGGSNAATGQFFLSNLRLAEVTAVQVRRSNQVAFRVERDATGWRCTSPVAYPGAALSIDTTLSRLEGMVIHARITARDLTQRGQTTADFGFTNPELVLTLSRRDGAPDIQVLFGGRTAGGDQLYAQVVGNPDIQVLSTEVADQFPRSINEWRDPSLTPGRPGDLDRIELTREAAGFALARDPTNRLWRLVRPAPHRADQLKVQQLLGQLREARVQEFVTDQPGAELERYGLAPAELELTLGFGSVTQRIEFGRSPTNAPSLVYARFSSYSNIVTFPRPFTDNLGVSYLDLRERRLLSFNPTNIDLVEVRGEEPFVIRRLSNDVWLAGESVPVDTNYMRRWLGFLSELQVAEFVKDVVTDYAPFGLATPSRSYLLKAPAGNGNGTNRLVAQVDVGTNRSEIAFVRRPDEQSVYGVRFEEFHIMPAHPWQLRDHRIWNFTTNQVQRVTLRQGDRSRTLLRAPDGTWSLGPGTTDLVNTWALEEILFRLGELYCIKWVARGETNLAAYGIAITNGVQLSVDLRDASGPRTLVMDFGGPSPIHMPFASTLVDGSRWVFEFPMELYLAIAREIAIPRTAAPAREPAPGATRPPP